MQYQASVIEKNYYKHNFNTLSRTIRDYILNVFLVVFKDDYISFIERYIVKSANAATSVLAREFLVEDLENASDAYKQLLLDHYHTFEEVDSKIYKEPDNAFILSLFHQALSDCHNDSDKINVYCKSAILSSDVAASTKLISFLQPQDIPLFKNTLGINGRIGQLKGCAARIRKTRNKLDSHDSISTVITREQFSHLLTDMKNLLDICTLSELQTMKEIALESVEERRVRIFNNPINLSTVQQQVRDYQEEVLRNSRLNEFADYDAQKLYLCKMEEVKGVFHTLTFNSSLSRKLEASERENAELRSQLQNQEKAAELLSQKQTAVHSLPLLLGYQSGHLTYPQQDELWKETTVLIETKAWLNREVRHFAAYNLIPALEKHRKKLFVDWPTRVELFELENQGNEEAKVARMLMSDLHRRGRISYLPQTDVFTSSLDYQLSLAKQNSSIHFVMISQDRELYKNILSYGLSNIIPVTVIGEDLTVLKSSRILLNAYCVTAVKTAVEREEDEQPEIDEPQNEEETWEDDAIYRRNHQKITLTEEIASGGEGTIYRTSIPRKVAKIIHDDQLTETRIEKMEYMVRNNPDVYECAWPSELLYRNGKPVGFLMREISSEFVEMSKSVLLLIRRSVQQNLMKNWNRLTLVRLCDQLCYVFSKLHRKGILMGDINPNNILVNLNRTDKIRLAIVDCDSMQMDKFHCPVGMKTYTNPDIYVRLNTDTPRYDEFYRTMEDELYAFTSLIFRVLMLNGSPYAGKGNESIDEAMRSYNFSYRTEDTSGKDTPVGPYRLIWNNMPKKLKDDFGTVFRGNGFVSIETLKEDLKDYIKSIENKTFTDELIPNAYWNNKNHSNNVDITCRVCGKPSNIPATRYEVYNRINMPLLCPNCNSLLEARKYSPQRIRMTCSNCSTVYSENMYDAFMIQNEVRGYDALCPVCRSKKENLIDVTCGRCGNWLKISQLRYEKLQREGKNPLCDDCLEEISNR